MRLGSMRGRVGLVVAVLGGLLAGVVDAQLEEPFTTWHRYMVEHRIGVPAAAEWLENAVKPLGDDAVPKLRRFLEAPMRAHVKKVMLLRELRIYNTLYGGTFRDTTLYLAAGERPNRHLVAAFHHEFSSLLFRAGAFPEKAWRAVHESGFHYGRGGRSAILRGHTGEGSADLHARGFFKPYGRADLENDFNVFSETVMTYPVWAAAIARRHPRLAAKGRLWQEHLAGLDPTFDPPVDFPRAR